MIIKSLEAALRDTNREATHQLLNMLARLRVLAQDDKNPNETGDDYETAQKRFDEVRQNYLRELVESLPRRAGKSRTTTAITILDNLPKENPPSDVMGKLREILLKEFDNLHVYEQERLLGAYWDKLRDSSLVQSLEKILSKYNSPQEYGARSIALERLIELDQTKARPFVIAEIRNPASVVGVEVLGKLSDEFLPEADEALFSAINQNNNYVPLRIKSLLAARFATSQIYDRLLAIYKTRATNWFPDAKASLLGYFARHNDAEAVALIEQALARIGEGSQSSFLGDLTQVNYTPRIDELLRRRLNSGDAQAAGTAAYLMSKYGTEANRKLIEERLNRWLQEWKRRGAELDAAKSESKIGLEAMFQVNMIEALINAKAWQLSSAEIERLKQSCITESCRRHFRVRE